jgi:cytochrome c553
MLKRLSILMLVSFVLVGCGGSEKKNTNTPTSTGASSSASSLLPASVTRGETEYTTKCVGCHGVKGIGGTATAINGTKATYGAKSQTLADYIDEFMPKGAPQNCKGQCAVDIAAYIKSWATAANKVLKVDFSAVSPDNKQIQLRQMLKTGLEKTKTYTLQFKIKTNRASDAVVQLNLGEDNNFASLPEPSTILVTSDWQSVTRTVTPTVDDATVEFQTNLSLPVGANSAGTEAYQVWVDDVSFRENTDTTGSTEQIADGAMNDINHWDHQGQEKTVGLSIEEEVQ